VVARIMSGFGCRVIAYDMFPNPECVSCGVGYLPRNDVFAQSDILTLHCPLNEETHHLVNAETLARMKHGAMLINSGRGALHWL